MSEPPHAVGTERPPARPETVRRRVRRAWRGGLRGRWQAIRAPLLLGIAAMSLVLGTIGYLQLTSVSPRYGFLDALYRSITLFAFGGTATPPIPVTLQIARIAAPILTGYAALGTLLALTRSQARVLGIRLFLRDHVIVCGLGQTGGRLAAALVDHVPVVVIEARADPGQLAGARLRGIRVVGGDASDPALLRQAGITRARTLVIACGSPATNVDVAAAASRALDPRPRRHPLRVFADIDDVELWSSLAAEAATFAARRADFRLQYFNVTSIAAQLLLERDPPFAPGAMDDAHVLVVGQDQIGEQLVLALARAVASERAGPAARLRVTLTGDTADAELAALAGRYPALSAYLDLDARPLAIDSARFQSGAAMQGESGAADITRAYVTLADEADGLQAALALHAAPGTITVPVTVAVVDVAAGVAEILGSDRGRLAGITAFGTVSEATSQRLLLRGVNELIARAQHVQWMRHLRSTAGDAAADNPNFKPWDELTDEQKEFNRRFADDISAKLETIGAVIVPRPLPDPAGDGFSFTADELERLAREEHDRWMQQRLRDGWVYGEHRDNARRVHDALKPYDDLTEIDREKDRDAIREIPGALAAAGFAVSRAAGPR
jgi:voltage-gated potassium channel Kch